MWKVMKTCPTKDLGRPQEQREMSQASSLKKEVPTSKGTLKL